MVLGYKKGGCINEKEGAETAPRNPPTFESAPEIFFLRNPGGRTQHSWCVLHSFGSRNGAACNKPPSNTTLNRSSSFKTPFTAASDNLFSLPLPHSPLAFWRLDGAATCYTARLTSKVLLFVKHRRIQFILFSLYKFSAHLDSDYISSEREKKQFSNSAACEPKNLWLVQFEHCFVNCEFKT